MHGDSRPGSFFLGRRRWLIVHRGMGDCSPEIGDQSDQGPRLKKAVSRQEQIPRGTVIG